MQTSFSFSLSGRLRPLAFCLGMGLGLASGAQTVWADNVSVSNPANITINSLGEATPYPSSLTVSGVTGKVLKATVTLYNLSHAFPKDIDILLVSPSGQNVVLMSDVGGNGVVTNATLTFDDDAASPLTDSPPIPSNASGTYKPTNPTDNETFPSPAPGRDPSTGYGDKLSLFKGIDPNGTWQLFINDDTVNDGGSIDNGWTLNLTTDSANPAVAYTAPSANQKIALSDFTAGNISGTASDDQQVTSVKVRISRKRNNVNAFWNGTDFISNSLTFVDADLTGAGTTSAIWSLNTNFPPANQLDGGLYGVRVYSVDGIGNRSVNVDRAFTLTTPAVDKTVPSVAIDTPTNNQVLDMNNISGATFSGTAGDNVGVASVKLKLGRKRNGAWEYWNGTDFTTTSTTFDAAVTTVGETSVTWQLASAIPADKLDRGGYALYATAYDTAGNKTTSPSRLFAIIGTPTSPDSATADSSAGNS